MFNFGRFSFQDMTRCSRLLNRHCDGASSLEEAADRIVRFFFDHFLDPDSDETSCVLARCFCIREYQTLEGITRSAAEAMLEGTPIAPTTKFLTLIGTTGLEPAWQTLEGSEGHKAIPLHDTSFVSSIPMISQLVSQFGLEISNLVSPSSSLLTHLNDKTFNVFHVPQAHGSPYIPAQDNFVIPYGVESVLGFGSMLPTGNIFITLLFSRTKIPKETAILFRNISLSVKLAITPYLSEKYLISEIRDSYRKRFKNDEIMNLSATIETSLRLLDIYQESAIEQANRSERMLSFAGGILDAIDEVIIVTRDFRIERINHPQMLGYDHEAMLDRKSGPSCVKRKCIFSPTATGPIWSTRAPCRLWKRCFSNRMATAFRRWFQPPPWKRSICRTRNSAIFSSSRTSVT